MATQVPGTQDEAMPDAHGNDNVNGRDEDIILGKENLVVRVVSVIFCCNSLRNPTEDIETATRCKRDSSFV